MKRYLTIVVCAAACLLTLDACDSQSTAQKSLTELKLPDSTTDEQLAQKVKGLTTLKSLDLSFCRKITDAGLVHLKGLTKLKELNLSYCTKITDAAVSKLQKALPNCYITLWMPFHRPVSRDSVDDEQEY